MKIHREGFKIIFISTALWLVSNLLFFGLQVETLITYLWLTLSTGTYIWVISFFRSPKRVINQDENVVLCPADGKLVVNEIIDETEFLNGKCRQLSVFMSPMNVHLNRYPVSGKVKYVKYHMGSYLVAWHPKSSTENERSSVVVETASGKLIMYKQIAGAMARRIVNYAKEDTSVSQGDECGFIKFGSRVDILIPTDAEVKVKLGQKVKGGVDILAEL